MYVPKHYQEENQTTLHEFVRAHSFATLVTSQEDVPFATHLPFVLDPARGPHGTLISHLARANPQWHHFLPEREVLVIFQGPHAYISPTWYESEFNVPTWNYTAVHAYGTVTVVEDATQIFAMLDDLVARYEGEQPASWRVPWADARYGKLIGGIVAFEVEITRLEGKYKLSQNKSMADRQGAAQHLATAASAQAQAVVELMNQHIQDEEKTHV